jgi:thermitase
MNTRSIRLAKAMNPWTTPLRALQAVLFAAVVAALLCVALASPVGADDDDDDGGEYVPRQIVVKLTPAAKIGAINREYGTRTISRLPGGEKIYLLRTPRGVNPVNLAGRIATDSRVVYAEPNFRAGTPEGSRRHNAWPGGIPEPSSDPAPYRSQYAVGALKLSEAHAINKGADSVVAVIDTGVQADHPELSDRLTSARYDFVDDDTNPADVGNGRDDDSDGVMDELVGHGTHVAGIVALTAPAARIMPVRALDSEGRGTTFGIAKAIRYAVGNDADVVNLSLGSSRESELLGDMIGDDDDDQTGRDAVFVAAAGNDNNSVEQYPAAEDSAIAVTSVDQEKKKSGFANYGREWVTIAAPGSGIYSPFPTGRYAHWDGTSMATPFVAGQAALIRSLRPSATPACVATVIGTTAQSLTESDPTYATQLGAGHADAAASTLYASSNGCPAGGDD